MAQDYTQVNFRIPTTLKEKIESSAIENNRSITSELVARLEKSFEQEQPNNNQPFYLAMHMLYSILENNKDVNFKLPDNIEGYIDELAKKTNFKAPK